MTDGLPAPLAIRRIRCGDQNAAQEIGRIRHLLSPRGDVVSPRSRDRTIAVFGAALTPAEVVQRIIQDVRSRGLAAVLGYTEQLDQVTLAPSELRVQPEEFLQAHAQAAPEFLDAVRRIRRRILTFQTAILNRDTVIQVKGESKLGVRYRPLQRVGVCVPGGAAAYPSTLLMTAVPAQAAGVRDIAVVVPPTRFGGYNPDLLAVCAELGIQEVYRVGGAQAVAALAYGIEGLPRVEKIVGPGNLFVALAKQAVSSEVGIDMIAGPTEIVVIADRTARPEFVAADLISQAEHSPGASILILWEDALIDPIIEALQGQLAGLDRGSLARASLESYGAIILARDPQEAVAVANAIAAEHLHLSVAQPDELLERIENAGAIFVGHHTPVAVGDYAAGPSHVLPTGGTARFTSGLCANDFLKRTSILEFSREGLAKIAPDVRTLAAKEGLTAHQLSVDIRLEPGPGVSGRRA